MIARFAPAHVGVGELAAIGASAFGALVLAFAVVYPAVELLESWRSNRGACSVEEGRRVADPEKRKPPEP